MKKQWEDWIIFFGCYKEEYDNVMKVLQMWQSHVNNYGLSKDGLLELEKWFFDRDLAKISHICCSSFKSMHLGDHGIVADWVDGGGLSNVREQFVAIENKEFSDDYDGYDVLSDGYYARNLRIGFLNDDCYAVIGMTLDGKIVIDTIKKYGSFEAQNRRMHEVSCDDYFAEFLETVKQNYRILQLPIVPKGILKLPSSI